MAMSSDMVDGCGFEGNCSLEGGWMVESADGYGRTSVPKAAEEIPTGLGRVGEWGARIK